ncbi:(2Fe-2S) ferredoxin domain-containing protein [Rudanella paleaurantiibacter]|uniref:(2Fe-2S) ferredoxin domain-containing protein n=1 Tax=Rudanella paleaurantiibacter TaxID=2614655 RepID=A0A7J5U525_9BACT|nr:MULTISPECIES: (2Fe-2S) ferredoxin domain-containing protein [Rudanella]KAB7732939.1 (2Fe-2S) ferredoxin domain-containing protein [Rudanella paleaurantiibacter]
MKFKKHVFICTNQKDAPKKSCGTEHGLALVEAFKQELTARGLQKEIRAQRAGCLDACAFGPALVVYPEGTYYGNVQIADVPELVEKHLVGNEVVERLELKF